MHPSASYLFETICVREGVPLHLDDHSARLNRTRRALFGVQDAMDLNDYFHDHTLPPAPSSLSKLRLIYNVQGVVSFELHPYTPKPMGSLILIEADVDYAYKYLDRSPLDRLWQHIHPASPSDLLITTDGILRDTTIANVALRQEGIWYTPKTPLLPGTTRSRLIDSGMLQARDIHRDDLGRYDRLALLNAMIGFVEYPISILH
jgi:4-amino-4-deoxychorismate lyase